MKHTNIISHCVCLCFVLQTWPPKIKLVCAHKSHRSLLPAGSAQGDLCRLFLMVHESCREHGATPSQYMAFLHVYTALYCRKQSQLTTRQQHLQVQDQQWYKMELLVHRVHSHKELRCIGMYSHHMFDCFVHVHVVGRHNQKSSQFFLHKCLMSFYVAQKVKICCLSNRLWIIYGVKHR